MQRSLIQKILRPLWFVLAAIFLVEAWLWDRLGHALTQLAALIPFESFKQALGRMVAWLPAPVVLLVFLIPLGVIEPFKFLGLWLIARHHLCFGLLAFFAAKLVGLGVMAFLFEVTRAKLLSMGWFEAFFNWMMWLRQWAHDVLEPYKRSLRQTFEPIKARLREILARLESHGGLGRRLALMRARARRNVT
jgi:hypothetical protein